MDKLKKVLEPLIKSEKNLNIFLKNFEKLNLNEAELKEAIYQTVYDININKYKLSDVLQTLKDNKMSWKSDCFYQYMEDEKEQDNFIINPFEVSEGALECKCGSKRVFSYQKQTRGLDESATTFAQCVKCGNKWVYSG